MTRVEGWTCAKGDELFGGQLFTGPDMSRGYCFTLNKLAHDAPYRVVHMVELRDGEQITAVAVPATQPAVAEVGELPNVAPSAALNPRRGPRGAG